MLVQPPRHFDLSEGVSPPVAGDINKRTFWAGPASKERHSSLISTVGTGLWYAHPTQIEVLSKQIADVFVYFQVDVKPLSRPGTELSSRTVERTSCYLREGALCSSKGILPIKITFLPCKPCGEAILVIGQTRKYASSASFVTGNYNWPCYWRLVPTLYWGLNFPSEAR